MTKRLLAALCFLGSVIVPAFGQITSDTAAIIRTIRPNNDPLSGLTVVASTALEACHVLKAAPGNAYEITVMSQDLTTDWALIFNQTTIPADGVVTPTRFAPVPGNNGFVTFTAGGGPPDTYSSGIVVCLSTTGPFIKTAVTKAAFMALIK